MKKNKIINFGCRLNAYESRIMEINAQKAGLENTIIINTCAVTKEAERQAEQTVRSLRKDNPEATIIVTGCSAQLNPQKFIDLKVDRVIGNELKTKPEIFINLLEAPKLLVTDIMQLKENAEHMAVDFPSKARAFLEIQNGCDHRCTFCTIPLARGNNRSVPVAKIIHGIKELVDQGCKEVVFTGVDITGYGKDLPGQPSLGELVHRTLNLIPDLPRLRLSSIDPIEIDEVLLNKIVTEKRLMPHIHLSLQSGHDLILKRMKRRHLRQDVYDLVNKIRSLRPEVVFGADIITGFPTETLEHFQATKDLIQNLNIILLHVFPFSPRQNTPAALMPQNPKKIAKDRARELIALGKKLKNDFLCQLNGQQRLVTIENAKVGRTRDFLEVALANPTDLAIGSEILLELTYQNGFLVGKN